MTFNFYNNISLLYFSLVQDNGPGIRLEKVADVIDNVGIEKVELYFKNINDNEYSIKEMNKLTENRYNAKCIT